MCVLPEHQGKGLGQFLIDHCLYMSAMEGIEKITLGTETGMRAYQLYLRNGFLPIGGSTLYRWRPQVENA
jgi:GNAT superfamily N-acetyltransferase